MTSPRPAGPAQIPARKGRVALWAERAAWAIGGGCLVMWGLLTLNGMLGARYELDRFAALSSASPGLAPAPDLSLWSPVRIAAWQSALRRPGPAPLGVLRIPKLHLEVAVLPGTDDVTLDRGVGHIDGTALPSAAGNAGIAGHRDGFFRGLKDIVVGDALEIETRGGKDLYRVERIWVVLPEDVSVLDATAARSVTLVTCYPFYFVGSAPQRYIVRAVHADDSALQVSRVP